MRNKYLNYRNILGSLYIFLNLTIYTHKVLISELETIKDSLKVSRMLEILVFMNLLDLLNTKKRLKIRSNDGVQQLKTSKKGKYFYFDLKKN